MPTRVLIAEDEAIIRLDLRETLEEEAEDARLRALVAETPLGEAEARDARKHADALARQRDALARSITALLREQDDLLDRMAAELANR